MKTYKDFEKHFIGESDIATLIMAGCREDEGVVTDTLHFGGDGAYSAYVVTEEDATIGMHYKKIASFTHWLKIYDDRELTFKVSAKEINIYRSGDFGCIIQVIQ